MRHFFRPRSFFRKLKTLQTGLRLFLSTIFYIFLSLIISFLLYQRSFRFFNLAKGLFSSSPYPLRTKENIIDRLPQNHDAVDSENDPIFVLTKDPSTLGIPYIRPKRRLLSKHIQQQPWWYQRFGFDIYSYSVHKIRPVYFDSPNGKLTVLQHHHIC